MTSAQQDQLRNRIGITPDNGVLLMASTQTLGGFQRQAEDQVAGFTRPAV
jgi:hypothetical protein